jgi:hypothetical protein
MSIRSFKSWAVVFVFAVLVCPSAAQDPSKYLTARVIFRPAGRRTENASFSRLIERKIGNWSPRTVKSMSFPWRMVS